MEPIKHTRPNRRLRAPVAAGCAVALSLVLASAALRAQVQADPNAIGVGQITPTSYMPDAVPFNIWQGMLVLKAHVGEGPEVDVALDTSLPICVATNLFAKQQYISTDGSRDVDLMDRSVRMDKTKPLNLRMDRVAISGVPFAIYDLPTKLSGSNPTNAPQVWLGTSALAAFSITFDPTNRKVQFQPAKSPLPKTATLVPFELKDGRIWVDAKLNGKQTFRAVVDTGSVGTLVTADTVKALKLTPAKTIPFTQPNGKPGKVGAVQLGEVRLGDLKVPDVQALYVAEGDKDGLDPGYGVIGNDVLLRYRVTIDYGSHQLAFEPLPKPNSPTTLQPPTSAPNTGTFIPGRGRLPVPSTPFPTQPSTGP